MDVKQSLYNAGFDRVLALSTSALKLDCEQKTLLLAFRFYQAEASSEEVAWIHPYYFASQKAYQAAVHVIQQAKEQGVALSLHDEIRLKPIFALLPGFTQGRNTLSYQEGCGSRFHVQIFLLQDELLPDIVPEPTPHPLHCGDCTACITACPSGAIDENGYHREKCIRNWMMTGKPVPEGLRSAMGTRMIGCDECQSCCPHNPPPLAPTEKTESINQILTEIKSFCEKLRP